MSKIDCNNIDNQLEFDPYDEVSYYYGNLNRDEVKEILSDALIGTFLLRDSQRDLDQKVLCVKEAANCINNYKIIYKEEKSQSRDETNSFSFYIFGKEDCLFSSIPKILEFYSTHYLNQSPLVKPAFHHKKVIAIHDFQENGDLNEDLYFKQDELLEIIEYAQGDHWWKAINQQGNVGLIPATLVRRIKPSEWEANKKYQQAKFLPGPTDKKQISNEELESLNDRLEKEEDQDQEHSVEEESCPFTVMVVEDYTPSPYEHSHIALRKGQIVTVLEMKSIGKWFGQINSDAGKKQGYFPFNRVTRIDTEQK